MSSKRKESAPWRFISYILSSAGEGIIEATKLYELVYSLRTIQYLPDEYLPTLKREYPCAHLLRDSELHRG